METVASRAPQHNSTVVYLITSYGKTHQLERLVRTLRFLTDGPVWLRHDYSKASLHTERIADMSAVILPPTTPVTWGDFSFVDVLLESLRAIEAREDYSWIVILSGQDYPIRPLADLERHLHELDADALLEQTADAHDPMRYSRRRYDRGTDLYRYRYYSIPTIRGRPLLSRRTIRRLERIGAAQPVVSFRFIGRQDRSMVGLRWPMGPFRRPKRPYQGSNWFVLSRHGVRTVLDFVASHPAYSRHYRRTFVPSESFFHSILLNDSDLRIAPDNLHFEDWPLHSSGPRTLTVQDLPDLLKSGRYLARKFDADVDSLILDHLDRHLGAPVGIDRSL